MGLNAPKIEASRRGSMPMRRPDFDDDVAASFAVVIRSGRWLAELDRFSAHSRPDRAARILPSPSDPLRQFRANGDALGKAPWQTSSGLDAAVNIHWRLLDLELPAGDLRQVEQIIDQPGFEPDVALDHGKGLAQTVSMPCR
jgi:hypothetical protein